MRARVFLLTLATSLALAAPAWSADHRDGPAVRIDPASDINDVFVWMSPDAAQVNLAMTVFPFAGSTPLYDTIDVSYSVLAAGALNGVGDGIANDADGRASTTSFPFFLAPR